LLADLLLALGCVSMPSQAAQNPPVRVGRLTLIDGTGGRPGCRRDRVASTHVECQESRHSPLWGLLRPLTQSGLERHAFKRLSKKGATPLRDRLSIQTVASGASGAPVAVALGFSLEQ